MVKDRVAWCAAVHGISKSQTRLSEEQKQQLPWYKIDEHWKHYANWMKPDTKGHMLCCESIYIKCLKWSEVAQSCPTLCNPMDCSPPGSSVHAILQARILEWGAIDFSTTLLRLLIFLLAILIPACDSSILAFHMMYSAYKLNQQVNNIQPWCTPFQIWNQTFVPWVVLTVASWPTYRFLRSQVRWSGIPIS